MTAQDDQLAALGLTLGGEVTLTLRGATGTVRGHVRNVSGTAPASPYGAGAFTALTAVVVDRLDDAGALVIPWHAIDLIDPAQPAPASPAPHPALGGTA